MAFQILRQLKKLFSPPIPKDPLYLKWSTDSISLPLQQENFELFQIIHSHCLREIGSYPNLVECQDFNDRIQWLKLFDQDREIIRCSDKIHVRDRVLERVGKQYVTKIYQIEDKTEKIFCEHLPKQFVLKTNHDSGTVFVVRDSSNLNLKSLKEKLNSSLRRAYGWANGEWAYSYIIPRILVEELLNDPSGSPADYKFYVVEGTVRFCHYIYDRHKGAKEQLIDSDGLDMKLELYHCFTYGNKFSKPNKWQEMISIAEEVGKGFKCVRVDLFLIEERIIVGEMTFWPMAGCYKGKGQQRLGQLLDFDRTTYKPFLIPMLESETSRSKIYSEGI